jgi:hypothetical protein
MLLENCKHPASEFGAISAFASTGKTAPASSRTNRTSALNLSMMPLLMASSVNRHGDAELLARDQTGKLAAVVNEARPRDAPRP